MDAYAARDLRWTLETIGLDPAEYRAPEKMQSILAAFFPCDAVWTRSDERCRQRFASIDPQEFARLYAMMLEAIRLEADG